MPKISFDPDGLLGLGGWTAEMFIAIVSKAERTPALFFVVLIVVF